MSLVPCGGEDIEQIGKLTNELLLATRDNNAVAGGFGHEAKSIPTFVDKFEKIPGIRDHGNLDQSG